MEAKKNKSHYIILAISALFILLARISNIEDYEQMISAFVSHQYMPLSFDYAIFDVNLLALPIISFFNSYVKGIQLYGYYIFLITFMSGVLFLITLNRITFDKPKAKTFYSILFLVFFLLNLMNLSSTRAAVVLCGTFFLSYEKNIFNKKTLILIFIGCLLIRIDALVFLCLFYFCVSSLLNKKVSIKAFAPLALSMLFLGVYNLLVKSFTSESFQVFYYNELDFDDRKNINYSNLNYKDGLTIKYGERGVADESFFKKDFVNRVLEKNSSHFTNVLLNPKLLINTFKESLYGIYNTIHLILLSLALLFIAYFRKRLKGKTLIAILSFAYPILACFYIALPPRFLYPYYSFFCLWLIIELISYNHLKSMLVISIAFLCWPQIDYYNEFKEQRALFNLTNKRIQETLNPYEPIFITTPIDSRWSFFNPSISHKYKLEDYFFINIGYFQCFDNYKTKWDEVNCKNSLNLKDKIKAIDKANGMIVFSSLEQLENYKEYLSLYYNYTMNVNYTIWLNE